MPEADTWPESPVGAIVAGVPVVLWLAALLCAGIAVWRGPRPITFRLIADKLLRYLFVFPLGVQGLWAFFGHVFLPEESASAIGWAPSPFQYEVGVANLGLGLASFYAAFKGFEARAATAIAAACFLAGAGFGHIMDILAGDTLTSGNAGPILVTDFLTPIAILALLIVFPWQPKPKVVGRRAEPVEPPLATGLEDAIEEVEPAPAPRLEDELERARKAMREALKAGPAADILPPVERPAPAPPGKGTRRRHKEAPDLSEG